MTAKWVFHPFMRNVRPDGCMYYIILLMGLMLWCADSSRAGDSEAMTYLYPKVLQYGALNTLDGVNPRDAQVAVEMNFDRLSDITNPDFRVKLEFLPDAPTAARRIEQQKLHALSVTGIDFIDLETLVAVSPLAISSKFSDTPLEPYVLLSRKGVSLDDIAAMRQRRLVVESNNANDLGRIWLETALHDNGLPGSKTFFTAFEVAAKSTRLVLPVFFGQAEACLVPMSAYDTMVELNPQVGLKLQILLQSPGFIRSLICIADYLDPELVLEMKKALLTMHLSEEGRQLMMIFQLRRNFMFRSEYLAATEKVVEKYKRISLAKQ